MSASLRDNWLLHPTFIRWLRNLGHSVFIMHLTCLGGAVFTLKSFKNEMSFDPRYSHLQQNGLMHSASTCRCIKSVQEDLSATHYTMCTIEKQRA